MVTIEAARSSSESPPIPPGATSANWRWLALGGSTGGPAALRELLAELSTALSLRVVVVQHIAHGLERDLASWLTAALGREVLVAVDHERQPPGTVRLAPTGAHLRISGEDHLVLDRATPPRGGHRPSIDELFFSLASAAPLETAAVLLSGMGSDGAEGLLALRRAGACCLAQDEASSAIFGMPRAALDLGAAELALPPRALGRELARRLRERN